MNTDTFDAFSSSGRKVLMLLARTPEDAAHFYNRLTVIRAAIRIGVEVMEKARTGDKAKDDSAKIGAMHALGTCAAIECCMSALEQLHPELARVNETSPKNAPDRNGDGNRIRRIDTD